MAKRAFMRVKILGHVYKFYRVPKITKKDNCGECDFQKNHIRIKEGMERSAEAETLLHEIMHAIDPNLSEVRVHANAAQLYQIITDNPKLRRLIFPATRKKRSY
jgi:hypothetical protein